MTGIHQALAASSSIPLPVFLGTGTNVVSGSGSDTFSAFNLSAPSAGRIIIVIVGGLGNLGGNAIVNAVTVGGISATNIEVGTNNASATRACHTSSFFAVVPSGTTGDIVCTRSSANFSSVFIAAWAIYPIATTFDAGNQANNVTLQTSMVLGITPVANSYAFAAAVTNNATTATWTNFSVQATVTGGSATWTAAHSFPTILTGGVTNSETLTWGVASTEKRGETVTWVLP
jgi:hypothetical protein